jgi:hypothetical protein
MDPLGFRGISQHYLGRIVPAFSARIHADGWYALHCWAAARIADRAATESRLAEDAEAIDDRRRRLRLLPRAIRMAYIVANGDEDDRSWRYGNSLRWWREHRDETFDYESATKPPFHGSKANEAALGALGCFRRSLERLGLFEASEPRLEQEADNTVVQDRTCLVTDAGRGLAEAVNEDLRQLNLIEIASDLCLWPDKVLDLQDPDRRRRLLKRLAAAIPFTAAGKVDRRVFRETASALDHLWKLDRDPLVDPQAGLGPWGSTARWLHETDDETWPGPSAQDPWSRRLTLAVDTLRSLAGGGDRGLFVILGRLFVNGMMKVLPGTALDGRLQPGDRQPADDIEYANARSAFLRKDDELVSFEANHRDIMAWCPRVERESGSGYCHFRDWVQQHERVSLADLIGLHVELPRFRAGASRPLLDVDGDRIFLESSFPWSDVEVPDISNGPSAAPEDAETSDEVPDISRPLQTWFWWPVRRARQIIVERMA